MRDGLVTYQVVPGEGVHGRAASPADTDVSLVR